VTNLAWQEVQLIPDEDIDRRLVDVIVRQERFSLEECTAQARSDLRRLSAVAMASFDRGASLAECQDPIEDVIASLGRAIRELQSLILS